MRKIEWTLHAFREFLLNSAICVGIGASHNDFLDVCHGYAFSRIALVEISLPLGGIGDGVWQEFSGLAGRGFISKLDEFIDPVVVGDGKSLHIDADLGFSQCQGMVL